MEGSGSLGERVRTFSEQVITSSGEVRSTSGGVKLSREGVQHIRGPVKSRDLINPNNKRSIYHITRNAFYKTHVM